LYLHGDVNLGGALGCAIEGIPNGIRSLVNMAEVPGIPGVRIAVSLVAQLHGPRIVNHLNH
jgi:hypothetical protein